MCIKRRNKEKDLQEILDWKSRTSVIFCPRCEQYQLYSFSLNCFIQVKQLNDLEGLNFNPPASFLHHCFECESDVELEDLEE